MSSTIEKLVPKRKKAVLPLRVKIEMLDRLRLGETFASISRTYEVNESTVRSIKKCEDKIRNSVAPTSLSTKVIRDPAIEKMEAALSLWIKDRNKKGATLSSSSIRDKAKRLYAHFKELDEGQTGTFQASVGWLKKFKARQLNDIEFVNVESTSEDTAATERFREEFSKLIMDGGYTPEQVFNAGETSLFWRKMPNRTFISDNDKAAADKVTLLLCSNASGDIFVKPLMVYSSLNPRALKNLKKDSLPVLWHANKKVWVNSEHFCDWFRNCFAPEVEVYLKNKNIYFKAVLVLDHAPGRPRELESMHPNIKVVFLPPNTPALLKPMDQGIIQTFKLYYFMRNFKFILDAMECDPDTNILQCWKNFDMAKCINNIKESLEELKLYSLKPCWKNLWPELVVGNDEESVHIGMMTEHVARVANGIGRDGFETILSSDIQDLLESKQEDLTESDLEDMLDQPSVVVETTMSPEKETLNVKKLREGLRMVNELCDFFVRIDPSMERSLMFKRQILNAASEYQHQYDDLRRKATKRRSKYKSNNNINK